MGSVRRLIGIVKTVTALEGPQDLEVVWVGGGGGVQQAVRLGCMKVLHGRPC